MHDAAGDMSAFKASTICGRKQMLLILLASAGCSGKHAADAAANSVGIC